MISFAGLFLFLHDLMQQLPHTENIYHLHFSSLLFALFIQSGESIYDHPRLKLILWHLKYNNWTESKLKLLPLIDVSKLVWYLERSDSKSSLITSFALSFGINFIFSLFECITRSSSISLEEIKLIAIVNWIFLVSNFWRLIIISLKWGLILSKYSFTARFLFLLSLLSYSM